MKFGIDKLFHPPLHWSRDYLSLLGFKSIHVSEKCPWYHSGIGSANERRRYTIVPLTVWAIHRMTPAVCLVFGGIMEIIRLLRGTFVSWWYWPRICPSVTEIQHYYHARYPTDDWHLAYMFSLVYFFDLVCWSICYYVVYLQKITCTISDHISS